MGCKPNSNNDLRNLTRRRFAGWSPFRISMYLFVALAFSLVGTPTVAQDEAATPVADEAKKLDDKIWERLIYLPYKNLQDVIDKHGSTVFMPYEDYLKLWQRDKQPAEKGVKAVITESHYVGRVDKSLLRIDAELTVQVLGDPWVEVPIQFGKAAVGKLTAEDGKKVLLKGVGNGQYALLFGQAGEHKVKLELAAPIQTSPDGRNTDFLVPPVGVTTFELAIPQADQTVDVKPQLIALPANQAEGETRIKANLGSTNTIVASWHPKTGLKPEMNLLASVTNYQQVSLRDGLAHTDAALNYVVLRGEMTQLSIAVPNGQRILGVSSANAKIKGWKAEPSDKRQTVVVEFLSAVKDTVTLEVHTEREFQADPIELAGRDADGNYHGIHSLDAVRESGQLAVTVGSDLSLQFEIVKGLARIEADEVAAELKQADAATFKFYSPDVQMRIVAKPVEPRLLVDSQYTYQFHDDELRLTAQLNYRIERAGIFEIPIKLPADLTVTSVDIPNGQAAVREFHVEGEGDARILRVLLRNKTPADAALTLVVNAQLKFPDASESIELTLPIPQPVNKKDDAIEDVEREIAQLFVYAPDALEVITDAASLSAAQPLPVQNAARMGDLRLASAWTFNRRPVTIPVRTVRKPTRLTAQVGTSIRVKEEIVEVEAQLTYNVQFAGIDTFRFSVPESVSANIQITSLEAASSPAIKQKQAGEPKDGWVTWTVTMQRDVVGIHRFQVKWDIKPGDDKPVADPANPADLANPADPANPVPPPAEAGDKAAAAAGPISTETVVQTLRVLGVEKSADNPLEVALADVSGEIVIDKDRSLAVNATVLDDGLEAIDVRELKTLPSTGSLAYRYFRQPVGLKIQATKHEIQKVVETVVMRALVEVVAREDVFASYRCRYWLKSSERQRLRIDVPVGEILGVFVNDKSVQPEKNSGDLKEGWDSYFINVARTTNSDQPFSLMIQSTIRIAGESEVPFAGTGGGVNLRFPQIGGVDAKGVATQQMQVAVWAPEDCNLYGDPDGFTNESPLSMSDALYLERPASHQVDLDSWVSVARAGFIDFPTEGQRFQFSNLGGKSEITLKWMSESNFTWLISGVLVILAIVLRKFPWDNKLLLILVAGIAATLFGLSAPGFAAEIVSAARFGIFGLFGIWILTTVGSWRSKSTADPRDVFADSAPAIAFVGSNPAVIPPPGVFDDFRKDWN